MRMRRLVAGVALAIGVAGCAVGISELNTHPTKHYEDAVSFKARVSRVQALPGETLLELADAQEHRIFVRVDGTVDVHPDDWVKVKGTLVPEARVGGKIVYDCVQAESVEETGAPWFRNLF
jgi:hypothetical protein